MSTHLTESELNDLLDGRLAADVRARAEQHLAECEPCTRDRDALAYVMGAGRSAYSAVAAPPELWALVAASTIHERWLRRHVLRSMRGVLVVAALALIAATVVVTLFLSNLLPSGGPPPPSPPTAPRPPVAPPAPSGAREELRGVETDLQRLEENVRQAEERRREADERARRARDARP